MAKRNKLQKFAEIFSYTNVVENYDPEFPKLLHGPNKEVVFKGSWDKQFFNNDKEIVLELACGRGEYSLALARNDQTKNYLGIDVKGARIWRGATNAIEESLTNVGFFRTKIEQIDLFFGPTEVSEIWITFPDPFYGKENRRLTAHSFFERYKKLLKPGGIIHLKTDDEPLYLFSKEQIESYPGGKILYSNNDIYAKPLDFSELQHKTYYELMHLGNEKSIKYLRFTIN